MRPFPSPGSRSISFIALPALALALGGAFIGTACGSSGGGEQAGGQSGGSAGDSGGGSGGQGGAAPLTTYYVDADGDGFGNPEHAVELAEPAPGFVTVAGDCDDLDPSVHPDALEVCDEVDNDCDGVVDAGPCGENGVCQGEGEAIACVCKEGFEGDPESCGPIPWSQVAVGGRRTFGNARDSHACAIRGGQLYCWGSNRYGQLGGPGGGSTTPRRVGTHDDWAEVTSGGAHSCGIRAGRLYCWGSNLDTARFDEGFTGLLGLGDDFADVDMVDEPTRVGTASDWVSVSAGTHHTCGIRESDAGERTLWCWGKGSDGSALGSGTFERSNVPVQEATASVDWVSVSAGTRADTCGLRASAEDEQTLWCWGRNSSISSGTSTPAQRGTDTDWQAISVGARAACGLRRDTDGVTAHCVGTNSHGQLADGTTSSKSSYVEVQGDHAAWTAISASQGFACGIADGDLYCWGRNLDHELGLGDDVLELEGCSDAHNHVDCRVPMLVSHPRSWTSVSTGPGYACAIDVAGRLYCWGDPGAVGVDMDPARTPREVH